MQPRPQPQLAPPARSPSRLVHLAEAGLRRGHDVRFRVTGEAMGKTIRDGEWIAIEPASAAHAYAGDVVLATIDDEPAARRVMAVRVKSVPGSREFQAEFDLRGDGSASRVQVVDERAILGRAISVERGGVREPLDWRPVSGWRSLTRRTGLLVSLLLVAAMAATLWGARPAAGDQSEMVGRR